MTTDGKPRGRAYGAALSGLAIGAILTSIELTQGVAMDRAIVSVAIIVVYSLAIFALQNRSETISVLAGRPVDERWSQINVRALAVSATAIAVLVLVGFASAEIQGRDSSQFALVGLVFALSYMAALIWYRWRS